jgi:hypothetical protein
LPAVKAIARLAIALSVLACGQGARAQEVEPGTIDAIDLWKIIRNKPLAAPDEQPDYTEAMKAWAPVIGSKPSAGVLLGVAGNVAFFKGDPRTTRISSLVTSLTFSSKQQTSLTGRFTMFTRDDQWRLEGDDRAQWTSQDTYGLGTTAETGAAVNAKYNFFRVHQSAFRQLRPNLFAGLGIHYDDHTDIRPGDDSADWNSTAFVTYSEAHNLPLDRQTSAGLSANLLVDTRDSGIDPRRGSYTSVSYRGLIRGFLGGSSGWQLLHVDDRRYIALSDDRRQRLGVWLFGDFVFGGAAPYFDLPATGMDTYGRSGRGYGEGRFRGERLLYGEVEYRATLTANNLVGMVAFMNATTVSNLQNDEHLFHSAAPGAGAGLRLLINKRSRTNLCLDFGFGEQGSRGVYLSVQEAF